MLLFVLGMSINTAWGQDGQTVYLAAFKAQASDASTGEGKVKLTWVDAQGKLFDNTAVAWLNYNTQQMPMPYGTGNPSNSDAFDAIAMMIGATLTATESVEDSDPKSLVNQVLRNMMKSAKADSSHLFMTPYAYFKADAQGDNGSYFEEWTFNDARVWRQDTAMDKSAPESAYFKVLPNSANVMYMAPPSTVTNVNEAYGGATDNPNVINAVFKKYLLSNPVVVNNGTVTAEEGSRTTINLSVDVVGDMEQLKDDYADFDLPETTFAYDDEGEWTWALGTTPSEVLTSMKGRANLVITYTAKSGITVGTKRATFVAKMQGINPSTINIPLAVEVRPVSTKDASVTVGETTTEYTNLADAVADANSASGEVTLTLLRDVAVSSTVTLTNTMTLDLNSYTLSAASAADKGMADKAVLTIDASGKTVTLAYNKQGGAIISAPRVKNSAIINGVGVEVKTGTLVLNGGTISADNQLTAYQWNESVAPSGYWTLIPYEFASIQSVAVKVASGATLIQNGATITATSNGPNAYGIVNNGTVTINQGTISAEAQYNGAMAVNALSGSTTTVKGGSLSALVHEVSGTVTFNPAVPAGLSTWSNVYGLYVGAGSTVTIDGGELYAESTGESRAFGVGALANFGGTLTINKGATMRAKSPNTTESFPLCIMKAGELGGAVTINGGKFDGWFKSKKTGNDTINPAVFGLDYKDVTFKSGMCKTGLFFMVHPSFSSSANHPANTLCNVVKGGKDYNEGYRYIAVADPATQADLIAAGVPAARIGTTGYTKLEDAIAYANNNPNEELVIFMTNNYTLPAGYYTIPAKATLVVPMSDTQAKEVNQYAPHVSNNKSHKNPYIRPYEFRRLTFANGVNMDVFGSIEVTGTQFADENAYTSQPYGAYGRIVMEEGSHITLMANSEFRAWGFVTGKGEMDARRDAKVREMFQLGDWKGAFTSVVICGVVKEGDPLYGMAGIEDKSENKVFPVTQYWIQNIESPVKYHPGAVLATSATVTESVSGMPISMVASDILVVGVANRSEGVSDPAIFLLDNGADANNTWIRKWYDAENDIQVYDINSAAHIGSMELDMGEMSLMGMTVPIKLNSALFDLPITSNMKIHLLSGTMDFQQNTCLLPGTEVEVDKEAIVTISMDEDEKDAYDAWVAGGKEGDAPVSYTGALYVYDKAQWDTYAFDMSGNHGYTKVVRYAPSWEGKTEDSRPNIREEDKCPASAKINVKGMFNTLDGYVYTTESGANIFSSNENAGTFIFGQDVSEAEIPRKVYQVNVGDVTGFTRKTEFVNIDFIPAKLKNGDDSYTESYIDEENYAKAGDAYCYQNDEWSTLTADGCFVVKLNENGNTYYAKPQEYVAVVATKSAGVISGNDDHTFSDAAGAGRLFILMESDCQWWEVEKKDNLYHCIHHNNDTYYYWDNVEGEWKEKTCTITWKNWDGTIIQTRGKTEEFVDSYEVTYGTMAEFLGTNPTRANNIDSTYNFTGWKPALGPVTQDVTYTATYESKPRMYTIIFQNEGETEIERQFLTHNAVPVCENTPTKVGHTLVWSPAISPVIGDQTYIATWLENPPTEWDVTFVNNAGGELQPTEAVGVNDHPVYSGSTPAKENADHSAYTSNEYTYTFWGWSAVIDGVAQQFAAGDELPCPTAPTTYTAVYTEGYQTYAVTFKKEDPENPGQYVTIETNNYRYGETPVCSATPTKENTAEWTYGFAWTPQIQTVQGAATYTATFPATKNKYTVTLTSNLSGVCTFTGAGTFDYGTTIDNVAVSYNSGKYTFDGWSDNEEDATHSSFTLTGDVTLTANFTPIALENKTIAKDETWDIPEDTEVKDLIITSDGLTASQLQNVNNLTIRGEAIFRQQQSFEAGTWYAVAVPWRVDPNTGIYGASSRLASGSQIYIIEFDGAAYAQVGGTDDTYQYWHFLHATGDDMVPGKLYMIYLASAQSKLDFHKKAGAALQTRNLTVSAASGSAGASFANWNAIANPALYTADLSTGVSTYQVYDNNGDQSYTPIDGATSGLIVAKPIFVQVATPSTVYATIPPASPAPYRRVQKAETDAKFVVEINRNNKMADRLIIETADEKEDKYVIGQDLAKFGVSSKVAQMWINRYDAKLCKNTVEFDGERADYPLNIFAPAAGEYTLHLTPYTSGSDYALYLTLNGEAIWNLSDAAYTLTLQKGNTAEYGLRISVRKAPEVVTGMDEAVVEAQGDIRKVLINNQVFIIRGDKVYTIDGQMVK